MNTQRTIEVKPVTTDKTNVKADPPAKSPNCETKPHKEDTKRATKENESTKRDATLPNIEERKPEADKIKSSKESEDSLPQNNKTKGIDGVDEKQDGNDHEKDDREKKRAKKKMRENFDKTTSKADPVPEYEVKDSEKVKKKEGDRVKHKKREKSEEGEGEKAEKKPKALKVENGDAKFDETRRVSENIRSSRSASRDSNTSQTSKKSNNVFGETITAGLAEKPKKERRRRKPKKDLGVVNLGADNEKDTSKEIGKKNEKDGDEEVKKKCHVRELPSLKHKTGSFFVLFVVVHSIKHLSFVLSMHSIKSFTA